MIETSQFNDPEEIKRKIIEDQKLISELNDQLVRKKSEITIIQSISDEIMNSLDLDRIFDKSMKLLDNVFQFKHSMILLKKENEEVLQVAASLGYENEGIGAEIAFGKGIVGVVAKNKKILRMSGIRSRLLYLKGDVTNEEETTLIKVPQLPNVDSQMAIPLIAHQQLIGVYLVESDQINAFKAIDEIILNLVANQIAAAIDNASAYTTQKQLTEIYSRFVPTEFIQLIGNTSILETKLADQAEQQLTILFADIRNFTGISEQMTPEQNFKFINDYLGYIAPAIVKNGGFIDKYIGDAIMAIFPNEPKNAVIAALEMNTKLDEFNKHIANLDLEPVRIGIGIHTGQIMAGIIGYDNRMDGTVIGDGVNIASRIEGLTKKFDCNILASQATIDQCCDKAEYKSTYLDKVFVKGKLEEISVYKIEKLEH